MEQRRNTQETSLGNEMEKNTFCAFWILTKECYAPAYTVIKDKKRRNKRDDIYYSDLSKALEINKFGAKFDSILLSRKFLILLTRENIESKASKNDLKQIYAVADMHIEEDMNYPLDTCMTFSFESENSNGYLTHARLFPHGYFGLQELNNNELKTEDIALEMLLIKQARINNGH